MDYSPRVTIGHNNSTTSIIVTKSSMTYGLPMVSSGNTWVAKPEVIERTCVNQTIKPKLENNIEQSNSIQEDKKHIDVKSESSSDNISNVKIKEEPVKVKSEPSEVKSNLSSSSSRDKRKDRSDRHCTRCYKRSKIRKANVGIQCRRDRKSSRCITPLLYKVPSLTNIIQKSNSDNLKLNLQLKNCKILDKVSVKHDESGFLQGLKYKDYIHIEIYPNGGASVVHMYQDEINVLTKEQLEELSQEYFKVFKFFYLIISSLKNVFFLLIKFCFF